MVGFAVIVLRGGGVAAQGQGAEAKTRLAIVGLDHDHVWSLLEDIAAEPSGTVPDSGLVSLVMRENESNAYARWADPCTTLVRLLSASKP